MAEDADIGSQVGWDGVLEILGEGGKIFIFPEKKLDFHFLLKQIKENCFLKRVGYCDDLISKIFYPLVRLNSQAFGSPPKY